MIPPPIDVSVIIHATNLYQLHGTYHWLTGGLTIEGADLTDRFANLESEVAMSPQQLGALITESIEDMIPALVWSWNGAVGVRRETGFGSITTLLVARKMENGPCHERS